MKRGFLIGLPVKVFAPIQIVYFLVLGATYTLSRILVSISSLVLHTPGIRSVGYLVGSFWFLAWGAACVFSVVQVIRSHRYL